MDGFSQNEHKARMGILNRDKIFFVILTSLFFTMCTDNVSNENNIFQKSITVVDKTHYNKVFKEMEDSLDVWVLNKLTPYEAEYIYDYDLDSLICFNVSGDRLISCIHLFGSQNNSTSDDLIWFYGEKIKNNWYYFKGADLVLPRSQYQKDIHTPLTYNQLHQIALKEVYKGYLKSNGEINEAWFTSQFEGPGWVNWNDSQEKINSHTRKDYEQFHLKVIRNNWNGVNKDSIKKLPTKNNNLP